MSSPSSIFDQLLAVALSRHLYYKESQKKALLTRIIVPKAKMGFLDLRLLLVSLVFWHVYTFNGLSAKLCIHPCLYVSCDELSGVSLMLEEHFDYEFEIIIFQFTL